MWLLVLQFQSQTLEINLISPFYTDGARLEPTTFDAEANVANHNANHKNCPFVCVTWEIIHLRCKKGKLHWMADLLFNWFGLNQNGHSVDNFNVTKLPNPNQSNRRSAVLVYFPLWSNRVSSDSNTNRYLERFFKHFFCQMHCAEYMGGNGPN